jgi:hypothetical protein
MGGLADGTAEVAGSPEAGAVGDLGDGERRVLEEVDAGAEAELPDEARGSGVEIAAEEADEVLGRNVAGGGELTETDRAVELVPGQLLGGLNGGVGAGGRGEEAGGAGFVDVEHEASDDKGEQDGFGAGVVEGAGGDGDVDDRGMEALGSE